MVVQLLSEILMLLLLYAVLTKVLSCFFFFSKCKGRWCCYLHMLMDSNQENGVTLLSEVHTWDERNCTQITAQYHSMPLNTWSTFLAMTIGQNLEQIA